MELGYGAQVWSLGTELGQVLTQRQTHLHQVGYSEGDSVQVAAAVAAVAGCTGERWLGHGEET